MLNIFLSEKEIMGNLFPLALIRPVSDIRIGILTIREKWERYLRHPVDLINEDQILPDPSQVFSGNIIPSKEFIDSFLNTRDGMQPDLDYEKARIIQFPWQIFEWNDWSLRNDFTLITANRKSQPIPPHVQVVQPEMVFIEEGAKLGACSLNASTGPVYIGKNAEIMEGALIRGPFALCDHSVVKMGARIYGATTIGPYSVVGGEIKNSVILGYSNKAHDGYLGDAVIGEWCNLGAGTSNSNMKNSAGDVRVWHNQSRTFITVGKKCGVILGDYSRTAVNTSFNTATVAGICCNIFGEGLTPTFIPNFTWGTKGLSKYMFEKAITDINNWKNLKNKQLSEAEIQKLKHIFDQS